MRKILETTYRVEFCYELPSQIIGILCAIPGIDLLFDGRAGSGSKTQCVQTFDGIPGKIALIRFFDKVYPCTGTVVIVDLRDAFDPAPYVICVLGPAHLCECLDDLSDAPDALLKITSLN